MVPRIPVPVALLLMLLLPLMLLLLVELVPRPATVANSTPFALYEVSLREL